MDRRETNSDYEMEKDNLQTFTLKKNVLRQMLFLEIVPVTTLLMYHEVVVGVDLINELLRKSTHSKCF